MRNRVSLRTIQKKDLKLIAPWLSTAQIQHAALVWEADPGCNCPLLQRSGSIMCIRKVVARNHAQYLWNWSREHMKTRWVLSEESKTEAPIHLTQDKSVFSLQSFLPEFAPQGCGCAPVTRHGSLGSVTRQSWTHSAMPSHWLGTSNLCCGSSGGPRVGQQHRSLAPVSIFLKSRLYWQLPKKPRKEGR